jgi:hypothetical protein
MLYRESTEAEFATRLFESLGFPSARIDWPVAACAQWLDLRSFHLSSPCFPQCNWAVRLHVHSARPS